MLPAHQILARFDRIPIWPWPRRLLWVVGFGFFFAFFDIVTIGFALPVLIKQFHVTAEAASWAITSSLIGYIVGSFLDSRLSDRFGRKVGLYVSVSLFAFGSLFSATSPNLGWLIFWRVISGMGIGAEIAAVTTYMGELTPAALRGRYTGWAISAGFLGFAVVPFAALALIPNYAWGWRALFAIGAIGGIVLLFMRRHMPQSPHWLLHHGRDEEAQATVTQAEKLGAQKLGRTLPPVSESKQDIQEQKGRLTDLFRPPYLGRLALFAVIWFCYYIGNYAWLTLAPELLAKHGIPLKNSIAFLSVTGIGFVAGSVIAALVSDRIERKVSTALICLAWTACLLIIGFFPSKGTIMIVGFLASTSIGLVIPILYTYTAEIFTTAFRATGVSVTDGLGHLGGAFCGQIVFAVYHPYGFSGAFVAMAAAGLKAAVLLSFGIKATGRSLHHL